MSSIKFLGASVRYYNSTIGWGETPSELTVGLVEDFSDGDLFLPLNQPQIYVPGVPVTFTHGSFDFGGIFQHYEIQRGQNGAPVYEVSVFDPRIILEGVQLILDGYNGSTAGIPNLINVYGLLEEKGGFGYSEVNDSGMPWRKIVEGVGDAMNNLYPTYGGPVNYRGYTYTVYMTNLPNIPDHYRIGGGSISLLSFIQEICEAGSFDWFCTLSGQNIIITTINRSVVLSSYGVITNFASNLDANQTNAGTELVNNVTSKFVVGGAVDRMYFNFYETYGNDDPDNYTGADDNTIWPFWGFDGENIDGSGANAILGQGAGDDHRFVIDARGWAIYGIGDWYWTDIYELRAALDSQEAWEALLWLRNDLQDYPQYHRAQTIGVVGDINQALTTLLGNKTIEEFAKITMMNFANMRKKPIQNAYNFDHNKNVKTLYDHIRGFAEEYYGKKFMVRVPFIYTAEVPETDNQIRYSQEPTDSGYIDESEWVNGINLGYIPADVTKFTNDDSKLVCYVRFDNVDDYDFSEIPDNDKFLVNAYGIWYMFVKCDIADKFVFLDKYTQYSPRAVITLPGMVKYKPDDDNLFCGVIYDYLIYEMTRNTRPDAITVPEAKVKADKLLKSISGDVLQMGKESEMVIPTMAALPLRSNLLTYGPWYAVGAAGKVEYEKDETLVPWNYGGYDLMDEVGNAKVVDAYSNQLLSETGSVTVPGAPTINLGAQLAASGPNVSDISCSIGQDGLTTTYNMRLYTPDFGKLRRYNIERISKLGKINQQFRRRFIEFYNKKQKLAGISNIKNQFFKSIKAKRDKSNSSHTMLCAEIVGASGVGYATNVVSQPTYNSVTQLALNYENKAGVSMDGIFRPYSTNPNASGIGHFESPASGTTGVTSFSLNPFASGHDIQAAVYGSDLPEDLVIPNLVDSSGNITYPNSQDYRGIAFKLPMVATGPGYDVDGNFVPSVSGITQTEMYSRSDLWKTGPIDFRWDDERKVWSAGGTSTDTKIVRTLADGVVPASGSGPLNNYKQVYKCTVLTADFEPSGGASVTLTNTDDTIYAGNIRDNIVLINKVYIAYKIGGKYILDNRTEFTDGTI